MAKNEMTVKIGLDAQALHDSVTSLIEAFESLRDDMERRGLACAHTNRELIGDGPASYCVDCGMVVGPAPPPSGTP